MRFGGGTERGFPEEELQQKNQRKVMALSGSSPEFQLELPLEGSVPLRASVSLPVKQVDSRTSCQQAESSPQKCLVWPTQSFKNI